MCGRYTLTSQRDLVAELELVRGEPTEVSEWWRPRWNIAPTQPAPVVINDRSGDRVVELMRWGLVPHWAKDVSIGARMINARAEGVLSKPAFREVVKHRRCLVPADGFLEWRKLNGSRFPLYIRPAPPQLVTFAGVWSRWRSTDAAPAIDLMSYSILTVAASTLIHPIHDRMPLVLPAAQREMWLDRSVVEAGAIESMIAAAHLLAGWELTPVSTRVNKPEHDDPSCLDPPGLEEQGENERPPKSPRRSKAKPPAGQGGLF